MRDLLLLAAGLLPLALAGGCGPHPRAAGCQGVDLAERLVNPLAGDEGITVLVFVSSDCPISNRYIPTLRGLQQRYAQYAVRFWLVYPDPDTSTEQVQRHLREYEPRIPILRDPQQELVQAARVTTVPEAAVFVADKGRTFLAYHGGIDNRYADFGVARVQATKFYLRDVLDSTLAGRRQVTPSTPAVGCPIPKKR